MVIGNGMLANTFMKYKKCDNITIFASGVSNSNETRKAAFIRERQLLKRALKENKLMVYFSSCDVIDDNYIRNNLYYQHKSSMEELIKQTSKNYLIFRFPQVVGNRGNTDTLVNYFVDKIEKQETFNLFVNHHKSIINSSEIYRICDSIITKSEHKNQIINVHNTHYVTALHLVELIEVALGKKGMYNIIEDERTIKYDDSIVSEVAKQLNIIFDESYMKNLLYEYIATME